MQMKKTLGITGLATLFIMLLVCFAPAVMAADYNGTIDAYEILGPGVIWVIDTAEPVTNQAFPYDTIYMNPDSIELEDITVTWANTTTQVSGTLTPLQMIVHGDLIMLRFDAQEVSLAADAMPNKSGITIEYGTDMIYLSGPGFAYRWH